MNKNRFLCKLIILIFLATISLSACNIGSGTRDNDDDGGGSANIPTPDNIDGFFVEDGKLYDGNGALFQMKGVNANHWWDPFGETVDQTALASIPYIKATGANTVRIVFGPFTNGLNPWDYQNLTTEERRNVVAEYVKYKIVPVVEYHNGTGLNDPALVDEAADFWIAEKDWIDEFDEYVIINITNEWAVSWDNVDEDGNLVYAASSHEKWAEAYKNAITKIRNAGIENLLVIDSFNFANSLTCILDYGEELLNHDPVKNIMFSIHAYVGWYSSQTSGVANTDGDWNADYALTLLEQKKLPVMIGEFNREHTLSVGGDCAPDTELIEDFNRHGVGWVYWMWFNGGSDMVTDSDSFSYTYYGQTIRNCLNGASEATIFPDTPCPPLPQIRPPDPDWNPGPVTTRQRFSTNWLEVVIDISNECPSYMEIEFEDTGTKTRMDYSGWGNAFFTADYDESYYLGKNVRFWVHAANGSVAKTVFQPMAYTREFQIDEGN